MPDRGALSERAVVRRLHDRLGLGATRQDLEQSILEGPDVTLTKLLTIDEPAPTNVPDPPQIRDLPADDPARKAQDQQRSDQERQAILWWLDRMATVKAPRAEKLTWFWHGHFATSNEKVRDVGLMLTQNQTFRAQGQDSVAKLAQAMVVDPALNIWLDNHTNRKFAPNENLGRELMELFTLGVGEYSESDVRQAARALTGWSYKDRALTFKKANFDDGPKTVLGSIAGLDSDSLVDLLTARPDSARFIATRLWNRLVSSDSPSEAELEQLTDAYGPGTSVRGLLRALATSAAFRDPTKTLVKQPVEWAVGLARAVGRPVGTLDDKDRATALNQLKALGQTPFRPPNVGGWPAGAPYITPTATVARVRFAAVLLTGGTLGSVDDPPSGTNARAEWARATLGVDAWSARTRAALSQVADPRQLLIVAAVSPEYVVSG
ncbi:DUF1800 domain-containing protein [Actinomycetospora sp. NBRC 106378]|uniref:DUF1800 domain-containing protein n=1 Tax=Actinomycetospora sp. NBRC 106378 TaxID=3032208 RepID=UPI0024A31E72|nr:DUF1800 domain-containing protein [Actinomycetospora sp. NBRC 106378]GLZ51703.1 hypothetical protein Acsp07_13200 [Actinomycetospora sp. NBRC 106378]